VKIELPLRFLKAILFFKESYLAAHREPAEERIQGVWWNKHQHELRRSECWWPMRD
jgi:hypothetical protein